MSESIVKLASCVIKEFYGEIVEKVANYLVRKSWTPLKVLVVETKLKPEQVKRALTLLIQQNIVTFEVHNKHQTVEYLADLKAILLRLRYPHYIYSAKTLYGDAGELIIEEVLHHGQVIMSECLERVVERLKDSSNGESMTALIVKDKFSNLARTHFIQRCPRAESEPGGSVAPEMILDKEEIYIVPHIDLSAIGNSKDKEDEPPAKKIKREDGTADDKDIYWKVNFERFHQHLRDQAVITAVSNKIDKKAGEVMRAFLRINELHTSGKPSISVPISTNEVQHTLPKELGIGRKMMEQYLVLLSSESSKFAEKVGDSGGGTYQINLRDIISKICESHIESVVQERFGSKCLRIFRLLIMKKHLEQKQIEEYAMIPAKEAKEILYKMFEEQFVTITEVPKTPDHAPSRTFYLFSVNMNQVIRMVLSMAYKTIYNLMIRREHETKENKRLLDKHQRVEAIAATLEQSGADPSQREEIEEMITPTERTQLQKVKHMSQQLEQSELQLDDTVFMLESYLEYMDEPKIVKVKSQS